MVARIEIPTQLYVGVRQHPDAYPRAMFTAYADDTTFVRRKSTIDSWIGSSVNNIGGFILANELIVGFHLMPGRPYENLWYCRDPRGFDVSLPLDNVARLMGQSVIQNGEIIGRCCYARRAKAGNILLLEGTVDYDDAKLYTSLQHDKVSIRDLRPGYVVYLKNGLVAQYLGYLYIIDNIDGLKFRRLRYHHFDVEENGDHSLHLCRSLRISRIISQEIFDDAAVESVIQRIGQHRSNAAHDRRIRYPWTHFASSLHQLDPTNVRFEWEPIELSEIASNYAARRSFIVAGLYDGNWYTISAYALDRALSKSMSTIDAQRVNGEVLLNTGRVEHYTYTTNTPTSFRNYPAHNIEHRTITLNATVWNFIKVTFHNPYTGSYLSFRLR